MANAFNSDISTWDVSQVNDMRYMFSESRKFNHDLSKWDVSNVNRMDGMFRKASAFNKDISGWDVSNVSDMSEMFSDAIAFGRDLSMWKVGKVEDMTEMFHHASSFNSDISSWAVSGAEKMKKMFAGANSFNQDLCAWGRLLSKHTRVEKMFEFTPCATRGHPNFQQPTPGPFCHVCSLVSLEEEIDSMITADLQSVTLVSEQKTGLISKSIDQRLPSEPGDRTASRVSFFLFVSAGVALTAYWIATVTKLGRYGAIITTYHGQRSHQLDMELMPYKELNDF
jgi:surface protein